MRKTFTFLACGICWSVLSCASGGNPPVANNTSQVTFQTAINNFSENVSRPDIIGKGLRVAILPLVPLKESDARGGFGKYFADRFEALLKEKNPTIRIFERERLKVVLDELALGQSGVINSDQAKRVGQIVPVDAIFTGSFTYLSSHADVQGKLIHVVTGEILATFSARIIVDKELSYFFGLRPDGDVPGGDDAQSRCTANYAAVSELLKDLSTEEKVQAAVKEAVKTPLYSDCSKIHSLMLATFFRHKKMSPEYRMFILDEMSKARLVDGNAYLYLTFDSMRYLGMDGTIDDKEFSAGMNAARVTTAVYYYNVLFKYLLDPEMKEPLRMPIVKKRIDAIMNDVDANKMGKPVAADYTTGFTELLDALRGNTEAFLYAYRKYYAKVPADKREKLYSPIRRVFDDEKNAALKTEMLLVIADHINAQAADKRLAETAYQFAYSLSQKDEMNQYALLLTAKCRATFSKLIPQIQYNKNDRIIFCIKYDIPCTELVPSKEDIVKGVLLAEQINDKRLYAEYLEVMNERAVIAETNVVKVLKYIDSGTINGMGSPNLQMQCLNILGNIKTRKAESLEMVQRGLEHSYSDVQKAAADACMKIGEPSVPYILKSIGSKNQQVKINSIKLLARMGKNARSASQGLRNIMLNEKDGYVRDNIAEALEKIR
jgi:hypothetical protein